jgi:hypothetical protein
MPVDGPGTNLPWGKRPLLPDQSKPQPQPFRIGGVPTHAPEKIEDNNTPGTPLPLKRLD